MHSARFSGSNAPIACAGIGVAEPSVAKRGRAKRNTAGSSACAVDTAETALAGWAYRIRTGESVRELSDWNFVTTSPEVGASLAASANVGNQPRGFERKSANTLSVLVPSRETKES